MPPKPNKDDKAAQHGRVDTLVMPPEKHISVPKNELRLALKNRLELSDRAMFDDLVKLMEGVASFDFVDVKRRMRENFLPFACAARGEAHAARAAERAPTKEELDAKELEFVSDVYDVLRASHFHLLTKEEWAIAQSESFMLNLPLDVDWGYMDGALMKRFWESTPVRRELRTRLPDEVANRILVFHRGVGTAHLKGLLIEEKLDLLCEYTVFALLNKITDLIARRKAKTAAGAGAGHAAAAAAAAAAAPAFVSDPAVREALGRCDSTLQGEVVGGRYVASDHKYAKVVERNTLKRACPTILTLLKSFPVTLELQEPTFKDVVVVYRRAYPQDAPDKEVVGRNIYIKVFGETPMADVEIIFPSKHVGIKPFQLVNLIITVVTALVSGTFVLLKAGKDISMNILWTAASLVLTRCFQVYTQAQTQKTQMQQDMSSQLYDRMQDSQEGVVSAIMEGMADQQFKQMLLSYMMLLLKDKALKDDDLDALCEDFLVRDFDHRIDFQIADSLPRLERWGLVVRNDQGKLAALPIEEAIQALSFAWAVAYRSIGGSVTAGVPTANLLMGLSSTFGPELDAYRQGRAAVLQAAAAGEKKGVFGRVKVPFNRSTSRAAATAAAMAAAAPGAGSEGQQPSMAAAAAAALAALEESPSAEEAELAAPAAAAAAATAPSAPLASAFAAAAPPAPGAATPGGSSPSASASGPAAFGGRASPAASADALGRRPSMSAGSAASGSLAEEGGSGHGSGGGAKPKKPSLFKRIGKAVKA